MRVPQVSDRIKEVPAQALRGVFAGIGQVLLITDRLRNKTPANQQVPQARRPERSETAAETAAEAPKAAPATKAERAAPAETRDFDKTGNVRVLGATGAGAGDVAKITHVEEPAEATEAAVTEAAAGSAEATAAEAGVAAPEADVEAGAAPAGAGVEAGVPLPNYDELSIASLRARLRNLDVAQVRQLAEYERAHAARADVIAMFERRIAKLEAETSADARAEAEVEARTEVAADTEAEVEAEAEAEA
jgi:hypothetical protein